ncbi:MAG: neutral/alkaline non-lysosomal ceramidase N-terminal domain-containing protein [Fimbriimonadia bacterium]
MLVGAAETDITPDWPVELGGFAARVQPSIGVHDPVHARALYAVDDADHRLLWLHAECLGFDAPFVSRIRAKLSGALEIPPASICLSATHTHSAPATITLTLTGQQDPGYMEWLEEMLCGAADEAVQSAEECRVLSGRGSCNLGAERRRDATAPVDDTVTVTAFERVVGGTKAVVANYAVHNVAMGHENRLISSDIHGYGATRLHENLPGKPICLMLPGACANINPPSEGTDFERVASWGETLAGSVAAAIEEATEDNPSAGSDLLAVEISLERLDGGALTARAESLRASMGDGTTYASARLREAVGIWQQHMMTRSQSDTVTMDVQLVTLGSTRYACIGAEVFSHMTQAVPSVCPVGCSNGIIGYLAPQHIYEVGGYEVDSAYVFYDTQRILPGGFEKVAAILRERA